MNRHRVTLLVYGANTYLGREVARFGRALGHRMVCVVDRAVPDLEEPWMHGVHWVTGGDPLAETWPDAPLTALLYCDTALWDGGRHRFAQVLVERPRQLIAAAERREHRPRFILRSTVDQPLLPSGFTASHHLAEQLLIESSLPGAIFRLPLLFGPDRPDSVAAMIVTRALNRLPLITSSNPALVPMRVETAALAMLRAALEPQIEGILDPEAIATIGDVMIAQ